MIRKILKENFIYMILLILLIFSFIMLFSSSFYNNIETIDLKIFKIISNIINDKLTFIYKLFTILGDLYIPIILIVCIFIFNRNKWYFYILSASYFTSAIVTYISKLLVSRQRPLVALIDIPNSFSFPSGHTLTSMVFYLILCYLLTIKSSLKIKIVSFILMGLVVLSIAFSRIYLGVHYFSDVMGGLIIGTLIIVLLVNIINKNFKEKL